MQAETSPFGTLPNGGGDVQAIRLVSPTGMEVTLSDYGATILSVKTPSAKSGGVAEEVTLCYSTLDELRAKSPYYGCTVGRVANRIAKGKFSVDGKEYTVVANNGPNHLHGGTKGFDKVRWGWTLKVLPDSAAVQFRYVSADGEEGYPGKLTTTATYRLTSSNELAMEFAATVEGSATPINICNHAYWNLSGNLKENVYNHVLTLHCPGYLPVDSTQIPAGKVAEVKGTNMDFTTPHKVGERIKDVDGGGEPGYDHCFTRSLAPVPKGGLGLAPIAVLEDPSSGRRMTVSTDAPGVQLYTGNFLGKGPGAAPHDQHRALCLETQNYPDAINQHESNGFPNAVLRPGEKYSHTAIHKFEW